MGWRLSRPSTAESSRLRPQGSIKSLDVGFAPAYVTYAVGSHVYEYPFGLDQNYNSQPQAVEDFSLSADGLTWTFTLREGMMFHNGNPVNADTMIGSYPRWIDGSGGGKFVDEYLAPNGMQKTDNLTWTMKFTRSIGGVPDIMGWMYRGFWIFDEAMAMKPAGEDASEGDIANLVGSGPYKIDEWVVGDHVHPRAQRRLHPPVRARQLHGRRKASVHRQAHLVRDTGRGDQDRRAQDF